MFRSVKLYIYTLFSIFFITSCTEDNRTWHQENGYRWAQLPEAAGDSTGFLKKESISTGIEFQNKLYKILGHNRVYGYV
jgi:hypothetical protein